MKLMIVESAGKIKKLSGLLGPGWQVIASLGHIGDLPQNEIGVHAPDFKPMYQLTERGAVIVGKLKLLVQQAEAVFLATDPDREGESISWHLEKCLQLVNPYRITFSEITESALKAALAAPRIIDTRLVAAQEARRVLDRLVGYMVSPELSRQSGERLSAGRVQSVAVRLVVERERLIKGFKVTNHFGAMLFFAPAKTDQPTPAAWTAEWQTKPNFASDDEPYFLDRNFAQKVAQTQTVRVIGFNETTRKRSPPPPFITSTLQQAASVALDLEPKETMEAAQKLYEQGHITYHRTDNPNVSDESLGDIYAVATTLGLAMADEPRRFKVAEAAQAGHPAITPTHWDVDRAGETPAQRALYELIRIRAIACQLADAIYAVRIAQLESEPAQVDFILSFEARGRTLISAGWLKLLEGDQTEEDSSDSIEATNPIPLLEQGDVIRVGSGKLLEKKTKPAGRFTQGTLINKLESEGIGRPATYHNIMDNILARNYVRVEKKYLLPTPTGELVVDALTNKFEFMEIAFTRTVEQDLDRIARGNERYKPVITRVYETLTKELAALEISVKPKFPCPECGCALRRIPGKDGPFWGCSGHPLCSVTLPDDKGKPGQKKVVKVSEFRCQKCGESLIHHVKKGEGGYDFWGCSGFKEGCKTTYENHKGAPNLKAKK